MGTWDVGPFDNDTAADFCGDLDEAAAGEREGIVRGALTRVIDTVNYLEAPEAEVAVAAAALVAAQCPRGEPADPVYGPEELLPDLSGLRDLARQALDRVMTKPSELMGLWGESGGATWRANVRQLQSVLLPQPPGEQLSLI
ncbi:DUF4259 domain-containing protein [Streptomyces griseoluteus]|uniref:DUF4259 domain-containing protein n=1 Tax=Streptomyces griseoluteus TaxID=29306 RepID=A0A4Z1DAG0_STRGP|nr:DUF4259 domain-containing protein [Streptomyces griseoluteus]TGN78780.1 DUF4259 domain-containing protein [Streptomyces griseoluteus]GHE98199.1 hypothetical protein GCM10017776_13970 [Streptomyces griseoluteus]